MATKNKNCVIVGSGRSGTSMVAGTIAGARYYMGDNLLSPRRSNPMGFFEDQEVNAINEKILEPVVPMKLPIIGWILQRDRPQHGQRWLARVPLETQFPTPPDLLNRITALTRKEPFCFKDPRFSYTLPVWRPFFKNTVFVCVFRDPASTIHSILKETKSRLYLWNFSLSSDQVLEVWNLMYTHILEKHVHKGQWLFIHFNQMFDPWGVERLEDFLGIKLDRGFPNPALVRTSSHQPIEDKQTKEIYKRLCDLAAYHDQ